MTKSLSAFAFGLLSLFAQSIQASGNETGNDLYANCTSQDPAFRFRCLGFIEGLRQGFSFGENVGIYSGVIGYQTHQPITASSKPIDAAAALELTHQLLIEDEQSKSDRAGCIPSGATAGRIRPREKS